MTDKNLELEHLNENNYQIDDNESFFSMSSQIEEDKIMILEIQEKERKRIASDLHDYSLQNLTHMIHKLELCSKYMDKDILMARLELANISKELKNVIEDIRNTIYNLRPMSFDDLGIQDSLMRMQRALKENSDMNIEFIIGTIDSQDQLVLMTIYRLIKESATNAIKHSEGKNLIVKVEEKEKIYYISVEDDGKGFDIEEVRNRSTGHFGLSMIKEKVLLLSGTMKIESSKRGTKVFIKIPAQRKLKNSEAENFK